MKIFKAAPEKINYCLPWKIPSDAHIGHGLKLLDIVEKIWVHLRKLFAPPRVASWLRD